MKSVKYLYAIVEENGVSIASTNIGQIDIDFLPLFSSKKTAITWMSKIKMHPGKKKIIRVEIKKYENH